MTRTVGIEYLKATLVRAVFGKEAARRKRPKPKPKRQRVTERGVVDASRAVMAVLATDCTSFVEAVARQTQRGFVVVQQKTSLRKVWLPSFIALGSADVAIASITAARSSLGLEAFGAVGGLGLMGVATVNLSRARSAEEALDAAADFAWGVQGFSYVTGAARVASLTTGMGIVGAAARVSVGVLRIRRGVQTGDQQAVKLGALDLGAGILWGALDVAGWSHPVVLGSYVVAMVGREVYANKDALREAFFSAFDASCSPPFRRLLETFPQTRALP
jgi:hypothetical protein